MLDNLKKLNAIFSGRDRRIFSFLVFAMIIGALLEIVGLGIVPVFVGVLADPQRVMNHPLAGRLLTRFDLLKPEKLVYFGSVVLILVFVFKNAYLIFNRYLQLRVLKNRQVALMRRLFQAYMHASYEFHLQRNTAELLRNVNGEVQLIFQSVLIPLMNVLMNSIMTLSILLLLAFANFWITLVAIMVLALAGGGLLGLFQRKMTLFGKKAKNERREIVKTVNQGLGSIKDIRLARREQFFVKDLAARVRILTSAQTKQQVINQSTTYYLETVAVVTILLICVMLLAFGTPIPSLAPLLALFGVALVRLKATISQIVAGVNGLIFQIHCVAPVYDDLKLLERVGCEGILPRRETQLPFRQAIELHSVNYRYPGGHRDVLNDINLRIEKGTSVAFIGPTGAGKTTLVDVILGLLPPTAGSVLVDGVDICENLAGWQRNIGYVPQVIYLTDDTIRHNIALGFEDSQIDDGKVWAAVHSAQLDEFVNSLPQGLDTFVGERGVRISGGQRQRIGIARALYQNPGVLVFDEGTSALDNQTEMAVIESINKLKGTHTILMIAHRLSTVRSCECLYSLKNGWIEAVRNYDKLVLHNPEFANFSPAQSEKILNRPLTKPSN